MKNNKKVLLLGVTALTGLGVAASFSASRSFTKSFAEECAHTNVNHHDAFAPTLTEIGKNQEYWICCDCHVAWADEAKTQVLAAGTYDLAAKTVATKIAKADVDATDGITGLNPEKVKWTDQNDIANSPKISTEDKMEWVTVDGKKAAFFSYDYNSSSEADKTAINKPTSDAKGNAGYTEIRFMHSGRTSSVTFDYKYYDLNADTFADGGSDVHTMGQTYDSVGGYVYQEATLVNDNNWHTITVDFDQERNIDFFTLKIQHFSGEIYLSNLQYEHNHVYHDVIDTNAIGKVYSTCDCGDVKEERLATPADIDFTKNTFGNLVNWHPTDAGDKIPNWNPSTITGEPTWANWGHKATVTKDTISYGKVQDWCTRKLELPKINYSLFTKVSFDLHVDAASPSDWTTIACSFDTINNSNGSFVKITNIQNRTGSISVTHKYNDTYVMNITYGEVNESLTVTDENIINGNSPLCFYTFLLGGNTILSNLQLFKETEHSYVEKTSTTVVGQEERVCEYCGSNETFASETFAADFVNNTYGASVALETTGWDSKVINVSVKNNADNSLSYVANVDYDKDKGHTPLTFAMELPRMDLRNRDGIVSFPLVAVSNGMKLSLGGQQTSAVPNIGDKGALAFSNITESSMTVTVDFAGTTVSKDYTNVANIINGTETFKDLKLIGIFQWGRELKLCAPSAKAPVGLSVEMTSGHTFENLNYADTFKYGLLYLSINDSDNANMVAKLNFYRLDYRKCGKVVYNVGATNKETGAVEDNSNNVFLQLDSATKWNVGNSTQVRSYISFEMVGETLKVTAWNEDNTTNEKTNEKSVVVTDQNVIKGLASYSTTMTFGNNWRHFSINSITFVD